MPATGFDVIDDLIGFYIMGHEANRDLTRYLAEFRPLLELTELAERISGADVRELFLSTIVDEAPNRVPEETYRAAVGEGRDSYRAAYQELFAGYELDALVFPTTPRGPAPVEDTVVEFNGTQVPVLPLFIRNTAPGTVAGVPGLTVPIPVADSELPVGLALDGPHGSDRGLLGVGSLVRRLLTD